MATKRIYLTGHGQTTRLVKAANRSQALGHVARQVIQVKVATQDELVEALTRGLKVEETSDSDTTPLFEDDTLNDSTFIAAA